MRKSAYLVAALIMCATTLTYEISARAVVVKNVLPHAKLSKRIRYMINPPFQMATPHRNLFKNLQLSVVPEVCAGGVPCNHEYAENVCYDNCPSGMCQCPNCTFSGGCGYSICKPLGIHAKSQCYGAFGKPPCQTCEQDHSDSNCLNP